MPKTNLDWLGIFGLWLGAALFAIKSANLPLAPGAPIFLTSQVFALAPFWLLTASALILIYRVTLGRNLKLAAKDEVRAIPTVVARESKRSVGTPNTTLAEAMLFVRGSTWAEGKTLSDDDVKREITDKLYLGALTAFGRRSVAGSIVPILPETWEEVRLDPETGHAFILGREPSYFGIQFDRVYLNGTWPHRLSWMAM